MEDAVHHCAPGCFETKVVHASEQAVLAADAKGNTCSQTKPKMK